VDGGFALAAAEFEALEVLADGDVGFVVGVVVEGGDGGRDDFVEVGGGEEGVAAVDGGSEIVEGLGLALRPLGEFEG
jgi:hypothetical protein